MSSASAPRRFALLGVLLLAAPTQAVEKANLSWDRCYGEGSGTQNRTFACDTNAGSEVLVCSFVLGSDMPNVTGNEIAIDVLSESDPLPSWWEFKDPGTCRQTSLGLSTVANPSDIVCVDWATGQASGGIGAYSQELGTVDPSLATRHRKIKIAVAVPIINLRYLVADTEYFVCNVTVNHEKTVGTGACAGCASSVCMYLPYVKITGAAAGNDRTVFGSDLGSATVQWQGAGANCLLVPVKATTWGQVKALYR